MLDAPIGVAILDPAVTAAGTDQASATQLSALTSIVTAASVGGGVKILPAANYTQIITNTSGQSVNIFPIKGMSISPNAVNVPYVLLSGRTYGLIVADPLNAYIVFATSSFG